MEICFDRILDFEMAKQPYLFSSHSEWHPDDLFPVTELGNFESEYVWVWWIFSR